MSMSDQALGVVSSPSLPLLFPKSLKKLQDYKSFKACKLGMGSGGGGRGMVGKDFVLEELMNEMRNEAEQSVIEAGNKERYDYSCNMMQKYR